MNDIVDYFIKLLISSPLFLLIAKWYIDNQTNSKLKDLENKQKLLEENLLKEREKYKTKLNELSHYKKHYFEKEFEVYKELCEAIIELNSELEKVWNYSVLWDYLKKEGIQINHIEIQSSLRIKFERYIKLYRVNSPFYSNGLHGDFKRLYNQYVELTSLYQKSLNTVSPGKLPQDSSKEFEKLLYVTSEKIFEDIKKQIESYKR